MPDWNFLGPPPALDPAVGYFIDGAARSNYPTAGFEDSAERITGIVLADSPGKFPLLNFTPESKSLTSYLSDLSMLAFTQLDQSVLLLPQGPRERRIVVECNLSPSFGISLEVERCFKFGFEAVYRGCASK